MKIYQEELQGRKDIDIFCSISNSSVHGRAEARNREQATSASQKNLGVLFLEGGIAETNRPFQNKIAMQLDRPLEAE